MACVILDLILNIVAGDGKSDKTLSVNVFKLTCISVKYKILYTILISH